MSDKSEHLPLPEAFAALGVRPSILRALAEAKFTTPSEIQKLLIPRALAGVDILGQARTGTGKTAAFAIPILQRAIRGLPTQGIILVPTRELAVQVDIEVKRLAQHTPIRCVPVYGGAKLKTEIDRVGGPQNITEENMPEAHIRGDVNTPYRCIGGAVYTMQMAGFARVGFISQPGPNVAS